MTKISNQYSLTNILTADLANSRLGINNVSPTVALDVTGAGKFSSSVTSDDLILTAGTLFSAGNTGFSNRLSDTTLYLQMPATGFNITDNALNTRFILSSAGAATFSSTVTSLAASGQATITAEGSATSGEGAIQVKGKNSSGVSRTGSFKYDNSDILRIGTSSAIAMRFETSDVERMRISATGQVGIGTTSSTAKLNIAGGDRGTSIRVDSVDNAGVALYNSTANREYQLYSAGDGSFTILDNTVVNTRFKITSGGNVLIGKTNDTTPAETIVGLQITTGARILCTVDGTYSAFSRLNSDGDLITFHRGTTTKVGSISVTTSATAYNTGSDYRLKEDLKPINGLEKVSAINVYNYKWKSSDDRMDGVLAHELQEVLPYAVTGIKDGEDMQGVDYSKIVPVMLKAIQELSAKVSLLENK